MGTLALAAFGAVIWQLLPLYNAAVILAGALAVWLALAILIWRILKLRARFRFQRQGRVPIFGLQAGSMRRTNGPDSIVGTSDSSSVPYTF
jgi:hypothetical protein